MVIDYTKDDFSKNGETYDVIFDTVGKISISRSKRSLKKNGCLIFATFGLPKMIRMLWLSKFSDKKVVFGMVEASSDELNFLKELIEEGKIRSIIDKCYPLEQIAEAHKHVESGLKKGNVVITLDII
jgi:NADPH:quinone reductase-like Zn-dependent oxidoreductase